VQGQPAGPGGRQPRSRRRDPGSATAVKMGVFRPKEGSKRAKTGAFGGGSSDDLARPSPERRANGINSFCPISLHRHDFGRLSPKKSRSSLDKGAAGERMGLQKKRGIGGGVPVNPPNHACSTLGSSSCFALATVADADGRPVSTRSGHANTRSVLRRCRPVPSTASAGRGIAGTDPVRRVGGQDKVARQP
jgi:hypothetical protein